MAKLSEIQGKRGVVAESGQAYEVCYADEGEDRREHAFFAKRTGELVSMGPCWCFDRTR